VTYVLNSAPTSQHLIQWIADVGAKRADEIKEEAGDIGSFVHDACEKMLLGEKISNEVISSMFKPKKSLKVKKCLQSFLDWYEEYQPEVISTEKTIWEDDMLYAGTMDLACKINGEIYIIDFKTSKSIHDSMKIQLSAYNYAEYKGQAKQAILHLGNTTKKGYSFNECEFDKYFRQFKAILGVFKELNPNARPHLKMFPEYFKLPQLTKPTVSN
jgi:ATP-dependent exoDNAse (exonuclease V) beta subunit